MAMRKNGNPEEEKEVKKVTKKSTTTRKPRGKAAAAKKEETTVKEEVTEEKDTVTEKRPVFAKKTVSREDVKEALKKEEKETEPVDIPTFFQYLKDVIKHTDSAQMRKASETCEKLLAKCQLLDQTAMANEVVLRMKLFEREIELKEKYGIDTYITADDIFNFLEVYASKGEGNLKICELSDYMREVPEDVCEKWAKVKSQFDKAYVLFTDYPDKNRKSDTTATDKVVEKKKKEKDPILFGALKVDTGSSSMSGNMSERLYFIADWVDEYCDLTFDRLLEKMTEEGFKESVVVRDSNIGGNKNEFIDLYEE